MDDLIYITTECDDGDHDDCADEACDCTCHEAVETTAAPDPVTQLALPEAPTVHQATPKPRPVTEVWVLRDPQNRCKLTPFSVQAVHASEQGCIDAGLQAIADGEISAFTATREFYGPRVRPQ